MTFYVYQFHNIYSGIIGIDLMKYIGALSNIKDSQIRMPNGKNI